MNPSNLNIYLAQSLFLRFLQVKSRYPHLYSTNKYIYTFDIFSLFQQSPHIINSLSKPSQLHLSDFVRLFISVPYYFFSSLIFSGKYFFSKDLLMSSRRWSGSQDSFSSSLELQNTVKNIFESNISASDQGLSGFSSIFFSKLKSPINIPAYSEHRINFLKHITSNFPCYVPFLLSDSYSKHVDESSLFEFHEVLKRFVNQYNSLPIFIKLLLLSFRSLTSLLVAFNCLILRLSSLSRLHLVIPCIWPLDCYFIDSFIIGIPYAYYYGCQHGATYFEKEDALCTHEIESPLFLDYISFGLSKYNISSKYILNYKQNDDSFYVIYCVTRPLDNNSDTTVFFEIVESLINTVSTCDSKKKLLIRFHPHQNFVYAKDLLDRVKSVEPNTFSLYDQYMADSRYCFIVGSKHDRIPLHSKYVVFDSLHSTFFWVAKHYMESKCILYSPQDLNKTFVNPLYLSLYHNITFSAPELNYALSF